MENSDYIHMHIYNTTCKINLQEGNEKGMVKFMRANFNIFS